MNRIYPLYLRRKSFNIMITKQLLKLILIANIVLVSSCSKNKDPEHYKLSDGFKSFVSFKKGSYWVYYNDSTFLNDSVYFLNDPISCTSWDKKEYGYIYDVISCSFIGSFLHNFYISATKEYNYLGVGTNIFNSGEAIRSDVGVGNKIKWNNGIYQYVEHLDSVKFHNSTFFDVIHTKTAWEYYDTGDSIIRHYYFSRHVGLIKFRQVLGATDTTWSLVRWHSIQ
jgi:hypothetical protein